MPVSTFKEKIASELGLPVEQQRLIFRGKVLKDGDLLSEYHVESGHTLHLVARQPSESQSASGSPNAETTASSSNTVVLRHTQRLLSGPAVDSLSHTARRLEEEENTTDVTVRTQIQTEAMQSGFAMQHLGALLLELGRIMLTLRIGQSHAESSVNAGPAVYISLLGPNPIMVQPFPLQTNSLFGDHATAAGNPGALVPIGVGVGVVPRHLNIHIHAGVSPRATNIESNQGELANRNAGGNSQTRGVTDNMRSRDFVGQVGQTGFENCDFVGQTGWEI